ncbi:hypothetical protein T4D_6168 [Trichinella pseudospiralis]|uniref:Uncharacterized protein n=1 Tax=Trichinella pseudospiralis TaxID=6337 RepID=A0A0V1FF56_TRIPS|nr:hypothetical protein T4D_6168 [Trichinella pseudospiralis]
MELLRTRTQRLQLPEAVDVYIDEWRCYEEFHQKLTEETFTLMNGSLCSVSSESVNIILRMPKV